MKLSLKRVFFSLFLVRSIHSGVDPLDKIVESVKSNEEYELSMRQVLAK